MPSSDLPEVERTHTSARLISESYPTAGAISDLPEGLKDIKLTKRDKEVIVAIPRDGNKVINVNVTV